MPPFNVVQSQDYLYWPNPSAWTPTDGTQMGPYGYGYQFQGLGVWTNDSGGSSYVVPSAWCTNQFSIFWYLLDYSTNYQDGPIEGGTVWTVYTNSISPTCEHDYHWAGYACPDPGYCATGACYTVTTLSNEVTTADITASLTNFITAEWLPCGGEVAPCNCHLFVG